MRTTADKLDDKLNQDTHDYCQEPEMEACQRCDGRGKVIINLKHIHDAWEICPKCKGTGEIPKIAYKIEEEGC